MNFASEKPVETLRIEVTVFQSFPETYLRPGFQSSRFAAIDSVAVDAAEDDNGGDHHHYKV